MTDENLNEGAQPPGQPQPDSSQIRQSNQHEPEDNQHEANQHDESLTKRKPMVGWILLGGWIATLRVRLKMIDEKIKNREDEKNQ